MGRLQDIGPQRSSLGLLFDRTATGGVELFAGIPRDTSWLQRFADSLRNAIAPVRVANAAAPVARALERARREHLPLERQVLLQRALATAGGLVFDATASEGTVVPGGEVEVTLRLYNGGPRRVLAGRTTIWAPAGWEQVQIDPGAEVLPGAVTVLRTKVAVPSDARVTQPYYLREPMRGALYSWEDADRSVWGEPLQPGLLRAGMTVYVEGEHLRVERDVTYRYNDQAVGEVRLPLRVVPAIDVRIEPRVLLWPTDGPEEQGFSVIVTSNADSSITGEVALRLSRWVGPPAQPFVLTARGQTQTLTFVIENQAEVERDTVAIAVVARTSDGSEYSGAVRTIAYDHIDPVSFLEPARAVIRAAPIRSPDDLRVGYVRGAADRVPEALMRLGFDVQLLDEHALSRGDLSIYDVIVIGSRAYETTSALAQHNGRLLAYVRAGGHLVVQYQQYQFVAGDFAPYRLQIRRPHDRVTDETVPVTVMDPDHPVFRTPNRIEDADWLAWPQERGLYFAGEWDPRYLPLLEMADPGTPPLRGGLLVAEYGEGTYVYTGLSFFRAIPTGTPGAVRLFVNLLSYGRSSAP